MENNNNDKSSQFKKLAIFSMGLKGGTGKTCFASYLYEYFKIASEQRSLGLKVAAYDCDTDVAKFSRIYGIKDANGKYDKIANLKNPFDGVGRIDVKNTNKMDMLLDSIDTGADVLIFDIPGGFARQFGQISGSVATFAGQFAYAGYNLLVCNVIDMSIAAAESTLHIAKLWGTSASLLIVKSGDEIDAESEDFLYFDGDFAHKSGNPWQQLEKSGARRMRMPHLREKTFYFADGENLSFSDMKSILERGQDENGKTVKIARGPYLRVGTWFDHMFKEVDALGLLPAAETGGEQI